MEEIIEEEIIQGILSQSNQVLEFFYERNFKKVEYWIKNHGGESSDAKDVFQDAIIALYLNLRKGNYQIQTGKGIHAYFLQICKFRWYDKLKKKANQEVSLDNIIKEPIQEMTQFEIADQHFKLHFLIEELNDNCKRILKYFYWEKLDMKSIGEKMNMEPDSVKNAKYRCLQKLRAKFRNEQEN